MKLFSWFIKANKNSIDKQESLETTKTEELESTLNDELNTFNNNTMWPIAKVKTTTMIIKKPNKKIKASQNEKEIIAEKKKIMFSAVITPLGH